MRKFSEKSSIVLLCVLWITLLLQLCFSKSCIQREREALLKFKTSFELPSRRLASWNGPNCCDWNGVGCNQITGHVTMIDLRCDLTKVKYFYSRLYSNSIDSSLLELKYLNYLDLSGNYFYDAQIPSFLSSMVELTYLNLSSASFSGKVPPHLGNLTKLDALDLSFDWPNANNVDVEWISHLSSLRILSLRGMDFSKASNLMKLLSSLPLLVSLRLSECNLQNIQFSFHSLNYSSFLSRIQVLDLSDNQLNGPIPKAFQNMTSLKHLDLSRNQFNAIFESGISTLIENNCGLKVLDLSGNSNLSGDVFGSFENEALSCSNGYHNLQVLNLRSTSMKTKIPNWLGKLKNLNSIDLAYTKIYGPIPTSLGNLSNLEYLDLSNNVLTGQIPTSFGRLSKLRELHLYDNRLEEVGDECFIGLENLEVLDISSNSLKGVLTEAGFVNLSNLYTLKLGYNELLSLDMKSNWIPPFQLYFLDANSCIKCFESEFPQWLQTQIELVELLLSNTSLSIGSLPTWLRAQYLNALDLSHNKMVGKISTSIDDQMPNLEQLFLNDNFINDSLPPSLCKLKSLAILDLSNNRLSGNVQSCLLTQNLILLDLSSNNFSGTFPCSHGNLFNIQELYLRNNYFEGSMPLILKNSNLLQILDLERNQFTGNIPTWIGDNLGSLEFLGLRSNLFNGTIPLNLCKLTNLQNLDLAHNKLEGSIPPNLNNFDVMTGNRIPDFSSPCWHGSCSKSEKNVMQSIKLRDFNYSRRQLNLMVNIDLSNNSLVGVIPSEITMLKRLIGLNLSHNRLIGIVPADIGKMESLESLDLSFNQLSGPIPRNLSKLTSLGTLKLSYNNFSGNIPREGQLSTFNEASSFDNNSYLCGDPLPIKCVSESTFKNINDIDHEEDKWEKWLLYIMIIIGFIVGFWAVVGALILNKSWRYTYFNFVDEANDKIHAEILRCVKCSMEICLRK